MNEISVIYPGWAVHPVAGRIGAEISGVRLDGDLPDKTVADIRRALGKHKVLFFREQSHLDDNEQEAFARLFGEVAGHPTIPARAGTGAILELDAAHGGGRVNYWHTDMTFIDAYPQASILRAVEVPVRGGDTVWANTVTAYFDLPEDLRALADRLRAIHTNNYDYAAVRPNAGDADQRHHAEVFTSTVFETEHPVVRVHPETGERSLVLGGFLQKLVGHSQSDSAHLVAILQSHVTRLENTVRWRWAKGDVAIWDNRATQHYAIDDYGREPRVMHRVTVAGDLPVGVNGHRSVACKQPTTATVSVPESQSDQQRALA
ncbi:MAG TPA: TauD/TfdA family dioxygenase [Stellaceae bacterium]|jgi:taurine dioxygenase|nr:TauD/TfdA family dioxygenase [Stellaceae bacterium]